MKYLLAIDPCADTEVSDTGFAGGLYDETTPFRLVTSGVIHGGFRALCKAIAPPKTPPFHEGHPLLFLLRSADKVIVEDYVTFNTFGDPSPLKAIGVVQSRRPDAILQPAAGKNTLVPNWALKKLGHWKTQGEGAGHHRDEVEAIRHAYFWLARSGHRPTLEQLSGR